MTTRSKCTGCGSYVIGRHDCPVTQQFVPQPLQKLRGSNAAGNSQVVFGTKSQFNVEGGSSACTTVCLVAALTFMRNPNAEVVPSFIDSLVTNGVHEYTNLKNNGLQHMSTDEALTASSRLSSELVVENELFGSVGEEDASGKGHPTPDPFLEPLITLASCANKTRSVCGVVTKSPESLLIFARHELPLLIFDPHARDGKGASVSFFSTSEKAAGFLASRFPFVDIPEASGFYWPFSISVLNLKQNPEAKTQDYKTPKDTKDVKPCALATPSFNRQEIADTLRQVKELQSVLAKIPDDDNEKKWVYHYLKDNCDRKQWENILAHLTEEIVSLHNHVENYCQSIKRDVDEQLQRIDSSFKEVQQKDKRTLEALENKEKEMFEYSSRQRKKLTKEQQEHENTIKTYSHIKRILYLHNELEHTKLELDHTKAELDHTKAELDHTKAELVKEQQKTALLANYMRQQQAAKEAKDATANTSSEDTSIKATTDAPKPAHTEPTGTSTPACKDATEDTMCSSKDMAATDAKLAHTEPTGTATPACKETSKDATTTCSSKDPSVKEATEAPKPVQTDNGTSTPTDVIEGTTGSALDTPPKAATDVAHTDATNGTSTLTSINATEDAITTGSSKDTSTAAPPTGTSTPTATEKQTEPSQETTEAKEISQICSEGEVGTENAGANGPPTLNSQESSGAQSTS